MEVGALHLQFLLGVLLLFISPLALATWGDMGTAMKVRPMRFFTMEHTTMMIVAMVVAQMGAIRARKSQGRRSRRTHDPHLRRSVVRPDPGRHPVAVHG
ncbi:MAG: hypothetical protein H0V80_04710 [Acidobacteria bacterium]|nr:hypothetical protein [Acidobacteriota bacterium]